MQLIDGLRELIVGLWEGLGTVPPGVFAIVGALIGVFGTQVFSWLIRKPRPIVYIDDLKMGRSERPPNATARPSDETKDLMVALEETPFVSEVIPVSGRMAEEEYVKCLERAAKELTEAIEYTLPEVEKVAKMLSEYAIPERRDDFRKLWAREQNVMWPLLTMAVLRKDIDLDDTDDNTDKSNGDDDFEPDTDRDENIYLNVRPRNPPPNLITIPFLWSGEQALAVAPDNPIAPVARYIERVRMPEGQSTTLRALARDVAHAIYSERYGYLKTVISSLGDGIRRYRNHLSELRERVQKELGKYDRLVIHGQISNTGGSPFSVLNDGRIFIQTKGHPYTEGEGENRTQSYYEEDEKMRVLLPDRNKRYDVPVSIPSTEVYRFTAVSDVRIEELTHPQILRDIFRAGDKTCYMGIPLVFPGMRARNRRTMWYTTPRVFRDWKTKVDIPPRRRLSYSLRTWLLRRLQEGADR